MQYLHLDEVAEIVYAKNPIARYQHATIDSYKRELKGIADSVTKLGGYCTFCYGAAIAVHRDVNGKSGRVMRDGEWIAVYSIGIEFMQEYWKQNPKFA
jgi:thymidine kinase